MIKSCLRFGYVELIDHMGNDHRICQTASISYGEKDINEEYKKSLINYLILKEHTSPFEMVVFTFKIKLPIYVARQLIRHRTASVNEISYRYTEPQFQFQARGEDLALCKEAVKLYKKLIKKGVKKEKARCVLPVSLYTTMYWAMDLNNLIKFLKLRLDSHAQEEIQVYAKAILDLITPIVPITVEALKNNKKICTD